MKPTQLSQTYRRRLDRTQPSGRGQDWQSLLTTERPVDPRLWAEFEQLCLRLGRPGIVQHNISGALPQATEGALFSESVTATSDHNHI